MNNTAKKVLVSILALVSAGLSQNVFAADFAFTNPLQVVAQDKTSVTISWDKIPGATGYLVNYGAKSSTGGIYENQLEDIVETTGATISGLTDGQKLFIAVTAIDSNFEDGAISEELPVIIGEVKGQVPAVTTSISNFSVQKVDVVSDTQLRLTFSAEVYAQGAPLEFSVKDKSTNTEVNVIESFVENKNEVVVNLETALLPDSEYELVAVSVADINGNTIQAGTDGVVTFTAPTEMAIGDQTLNAAQTEETPAVTPVAQTGTAVEDAAAQANALPKTGPKEMMIVILALMLGGIVAFYRRKA